tara:strand:- start:355 stop:822 length:468 start_codon:yes stop_codon:yes gene_type:complete
MNRKPTGTPVNPHQWFSGAIYHLGKSTLIKIWNVSERTIERWSADSAFTESVTKNALDMLAITLEKLMEKGRIDFARSAVDFLARIVGCQLVCSDGVEPDKATLEDELLDTWPAISGFQTTMRDQEPVPVVRDLYRHARRELDEDMKIYEEKYNG